MEQIRRNAFWPLIGVGVVMVAVFGTLLLVQPRTNEWFATLFLLGVFYVVYPPLLRLYRSARAKRRAAMNDARNHGVVPPR